MLAQPGDCYVPATREFYNAIYNPRVPEALDADGSTIDDDGDYFFNGAKMARRHQPLEPPRVKALDRISPSFMVHCAFCTMALCVYDLPGECQKCKKGHVFACHQCPSNPELCWICTERPHVCLSACLTGCKVRPPPFCNCRQRALRIQVAKDGPSKGRMFYTCAKRACKFFQWEYI